MRNYCWGELCYSLYYAEGQIECAKRFSLPVLNLWNESGINEYNCKQQCPDSILF